MADKLIVNQKRWGDNLSAEQWREIAAGNLNAAAFERDLRLKAEASLDQMRERVKVLEGVASAVADAMLHGGDGASGDFGWNIGKLNKARPLIRQALSEQPISKEDGT